MSFKEGVHTGVFELIDNRKVFGSLEIAGRNSTIVLNDDTEFPPVPGAYETLHGVLHDGDHVALVNCVLLSVTRSGTSSRKRYSAKLFPNTIVVGPKRIDVEAEGIILSSVLLSDSSSVFYHFDAFSGIRDSRPFLPLLIEDKANVGIPAIGAAPIIGYFNGIFDIASASTCLGTVTARYRVSETMGGPSGWSVSGRIWISIEFGSPLSLSAAMNRLHVLTRFFELLCGRRQMLGGVEVRLAGQSDRERAMTVYEVHAPRMSDTRANDLDGRRDPGPRDVLICTAEDRNLFSHVVERYLERDSNWRDARGRLRENLNSGSSYSIERIISAANMFDILPMSACPTGVEISREVELARDAANGLFRTLPDSIERSSILSALGRVGKPNLKQKVLHRMKVASLDASFDGLSAVLREAVNCRNHYVHGSPAVIDYSENFEVVIFFVSALEFVFGVSDLVECGWDFLAWKAGSPQMDHPFGEFLLGYRERNEHFKSLLAAKNGVRDNFRP